MTLSKKVSSFISVSGDWSGNELFSAVVDRYGSRLLRWKKVILLFLQMGLLVVLVLIH
ncbi:MAG: hypothetical protein KJO35_09735 [Gammaproteobacteria bacterium]|nr:hypothetical protein [Gammaproteobacteria bacterium]